MMTECEQYKKSLETLAQYFTSGNQIPVEKATILAVDFWKITGMTPKVK